MLAATPRNIAVPPKSRSASALPASPSCPLGSPGASSPAGPSPLPQPPTTASLIGIQPTRRSFFGYSLPPRFDPPEWVPLDNYRPAPGPTASPPGISMPLQTQYASDLPPLPPVPQRQAKRHRRSSKAEDRKTDLFRLQVAYSLNPVSGALAKSSKCVLTGDWRVAQQEMRHVRAMERIEAKKSDGRWSLRQPKKPRGPAVRKARWDYLLEEMVGQLSWI